MFPSLQYIIRLRKVNRGYAEELSPSAPIPHLIFRLIFTSASTNTLIINSLELLIKLVTIQLYLQPFHYIREQSYTSTYISNIKSEYICLNRITDILKTTKECNSSVTFDNPNDVVYLYRLAEEAPLLYTKLALRENGLQDYVDAMNEFN